MGTSQPKDSGWAALTYHKHKGAAPDPGPRKHCLQNDGKSDERRGVRAGGDLECREYEWERYRGR